MAGKGVMPPGWKLGDPKPFGTGGRPTDRFRKLVPEEMRAILSKLKRVSPKALQLIIDQMMDEQLDATQRARLAKEILTIQFQAYAAAERLANFTLKGDPSAAEKAGVDDDDDEPKGSVLQFTLVDTKATKE